MARLWDRALSGLALGSPTPAETHLALAKPEAAPAFSERDLPEALDQKMVTWEAVQKENFLSKLEKRRKDSEQEVLRKTAHRCVGAG